MLNFFSIFFILVSLQQGIFYAVMALGIYITFRVLDLPDLTVDGSFVLGMAISAMVTIHANPYLALIMALMGGLLAGTITGLLQTKMGIHPILSGILVMTGLYSINMAVMGGKPNLSLTMKETIFTQITIFDSSIKYSEDMNKLFIGICFVLIFGLILGIFFKTRLGLAIRATGDNENMVRSSSINSDRMKCIGLALGNGLVALSGGLIAQFNSSADITSGTGMVVIGLASIIIGEAFFGKRGVTIGLISSVLGSILYWVIIAVALKINIFPAYSLKLINSCIVAFALFLPKIKESIHISQTKRRCK